MATPFQCRMCGNCCRDMRGRTTKKNSELPRVGRNFFIAVPPSQKTIGLFEWEVDFLKKKADQLSLRFRAKPDAIFLDEVSNVPIVTQWNLDHDDCPFLSNKNLCRIHSRKPLICQAYPLFVFGLLSEETSLTQLELADCPNAVPLPFPKGKLMKIKPSILFRDLFKVYGSSFLGMLRLDGATKLLGNLLRNLEKEKLICPAILKKKTIKVLLRNKPVGLLEHLRKKYPFTERELRKHIESIYEVDVASLGRLVEEG